MAGFTRTELGVVGTAGVLVFSRVFGLSLVLPNFRPHFEDAFGSPAVWIGTAFGAYGLTMALMQLPAGVVSDRWGRRPVLLLGSIFFVGGSLGAAFAPSIGWLIAARLVQGMGAIASVAMAAVGETVAAERRTTAMALVGIPAGSGFFVGVLAGPVLYPLVSMEGLFLITAGLGLAAGIPLLRLHLPPPQLGRPAATGRPVMALAFAGFTSSYLLTTTLFFLPTTDWQALLPMLLVALLSVGLIGQLVDRLRLTWQPIVVALVVLAGAAPLFALGPGVWLFVGGGLFFLAHATLSTTLPSQVSRLAGASGGRGHGVQNIVQYMGTFVAGPVAGLLVARAGWDFALAGAFALVALSVVRLTLGAPQDS